jgi:hypothetical protein
VPLQIVLLVVMDWYWVLVHPIAGFPIETITALAAWVTDNITTAAAIQLAILLERMSAFLFLTSTRLGDNTSRRHTPSIMVTSGIHRNGPTDEYYCSFRRILRSPRSAGGEATAAVRDPERANGIWQLGWTANSRQPNNCPGGAVGHSDKQVDILETQSYRKSPGISPINETPEATRKAT